MEKEKNFAAAEQMREAKMKKDKKKKLLFRQ